MKNKETPYIEVGGDNLRISHDDRKKRIEESKRINDPYNFEYGGIKVRVLFEGTADLNDLVKGLFLTG